jgi:hypothetical protein
MPVFTAVLLDLSLQRSNEMTGSACRGLYSSAMWPHWHNPDFRITITGNAISAYAAVVSTMTGAAQIFNYWRDRRSVKVTVRHNMQIYGDFRYQGKTLTIVTVANTGRRPVTINSVGEIKDYPHLSLVQTDCQPQLPHELTEGKILNAMLTTADVDLSTVLWWTASDAIRKQYYSNGTWFQRWLWSRRTINGLRKEKQKKKTT